MLNSSIGLSVTIPTCIVQTTLAEREQHAQSPSPQGPLNLALNKTLSYVCQRASPRDHEVEFAPPVSCSTAFPAPEYNVGLSWPHSLENEVEKFPGR